MISKINVDFDTETATILQLQQHFLQIQLMQLLSVASATGITVGDFVIGDGVPAGSYVTSISGTNITISETIPSTYTVASGTAVRFLEAMTVAVTGLSDDLATDGIGVTVFDEVKLVKKIFSSCNWSGNI